MPETLNRAARALAMRKSPEAKTCDRQHVYVTRIKVLRDRIGMKHRETKALGFCFPRRFSTRFYARGILAVVEMAVRSYFERIRAHLHQGDHT